MSVPAGIGQPTENGLYACKVYHGWKLLEWIDDKWCFDGVHHRWMAPDPTSWVGPLREVEFDL